VSGFRRQERSFWALKPESRLWRENLKPFAQPKAMSFLITNSRDLRPL